MTQTRPARTAALAPPEPDLTPEAMIARAVAMRDELIAEAPAGEERGGYSERLHERFTEAGFYRVLQPRRYGGYEFGLDTFFRLITELSHGDPATGWSVCLASDHIFHIASFFSEQAQEELFGPDGHFCAPHRAAPSGTAERVPGGYRVTGTWDYCSGITHASHFIATAMGPVPGGDGPLVPLACVLPRADCTVLDDWGGGATLGLQGTGSNSVRVDGTFVPEHLAEPYDWKGFELPPGGTPGYRLHRNPLYLGRSLTIYYGGLAAPVVGAAFAALDEYEQILRTRPTTVPPKVLRCESPDYQRWFGEAQSLADSALAVLVAAGADYTAAGREWERTGSFGVVEDVRSRGMAQQAARLGAEAVDRLFATGGTSAAKRGSRLQRCFRDVAMYRTHIGAQADLHFAANARVHFGIPTPL
ncbi:3-hydroxy-9,10-secoandrosta-1,3,5(10)-triene-9,17-dione monooxygenase [Pseudonocardia hierapolitana]|uniref:3-hydroxy-9,10-secoandrosta-1,3,5(10)-triene-9, 17-dione monooxygenase n=1 Tax=Pseudonocardia hierapolitana TaxID=1128676 RepID=A0A561T4P3_9PSEU|nr:acyl-CoA dehydrogenase family protein [Pseudonocardia hierapolitana]TWF82074.1 3-hydroxy-9,10-secoandrosta-1,3,5(10)-triene-9,17-dione monooxygenase [Pseudonocardia hierapolitana]